MQVIEETAAKFGLAALIQEKPFQGINGSGKHNNWSVSTAEGVQLLNPAQMFAKTNNADIFPVVRDAKKQLGRSTEHQLLTPVGSPACR